MHARFFTVSGSAYFAGTAGLLNSLRLTGHPQELVVLDRGLTPDQRRVLGQEATLFELPFQRDAHAYLVKPFPALMRLEGVVVLIDSDMIVTSSLEPILERAASGSICVFPNHPSFLDRWFDDWSEIFRLRAPLRRRTYVNSGFVALSVDRWPGVLPRWWEACEQIEAYLASGEDPGPVEQPDQDALNAILMSEIPDEAVKQLPAYEWHLGRVAIEDETSLACLSGAERQPLLHTPRTPKVWQRGGWRHVEAATRAYVRLMPRVLFADDVPVQLSANDVPLWLRPGVLPRLTARGISALNGLPGALARVRRAPHRLGREARKGVEYVRGVARRSR